VSQLIIVYNTYRYTILWLLVMVVGGVFGGWMTATALCIPLLFIKNKLLKVETLFMILIITFCLGDNFSGPLSFAQNLRFVVLGISLLMLYNFDIYKYNIARYILPFALVATGITLFLSPFGLMATIRGLSYFIVALVVFKFVQILVDYNQQRFYNLIVTVLTLYFTLNLLVFFLPFLGEADMKGRFMGLMANPNGLAMVSLFSYVIIDVIKKTAQPSASNIFLLLKALLVVLIILSGSRSAIFSVFIYEVSLRLLKYKFLLGLTLVCLVYIYGISATLDLNAIVKSLGLSSFLRVDSLEDASGRTEVWAVAIEEIKRQPWLGKGMLYDTSYIKYYADRYIGDVRERHWGGIWNSYLSLLLNVGIVGLVAFSFFWYKMFALSKMKIVRFAFLMLCLFSAISESWMAASMNAFMPLVFICWGLQIYHPNSKIEKL
tara:strand:- start:5572 stop:6873 length:1302 start_codon:yes stop_codon:yes gene_type:complete